MASPWPLTFSSGERPRALWALLFIVSVLLSSCDLNKQGLEPNAVLSVMITYTSIALNPDSVSAHTPMWRWAVWRLLRWLLATWTNVSFLDVGSPSPSHLMFCWGSSRLPGVSLALYSLSASLHKEQVELFRSPLFLEKNFLSQKAIDTVLKLYAISRTPTKFNLTCVHCD